MHGVRGIPPMGGGRLVRSRRHPGRPSRERLLPTFRSCLAREHRRRLYVGAGSLLHPDSAARQDRVGCRENSRNRCASHRRAMKSKMRWASRCSAYTFQADEAIHSGYAGMVEGYQREIAGLADAIAAVLTSPGSGLGRSGRGVYGAAVPAVSIAPMESASAAAAVCAFARASSTCVSPWTTAFSSVARSV
jgi:hypothetical protein